MTAGYQTYEDAEREARAKNGGKANGKPWQFEIINLDDIDPGKEPPWLIDHLIPATGLTVVFGLPKSGKSFLVADAAFHVAMGLPWAGRSVLAGSVAYCAGEGVTGFKRRLAAFRQHYAVEGQGVPFGLIPVAPNLGTEAGDDLKLVATLRAWIGNTRPQLRVVVIDTLSRAMRGADENTAKDMGIFVSNCEGVARALNCAIMVVHHAGKEIDRGSRGSTALPAACDCMWQVEKGETANKVTITAMKDGEDGLSWRFRLVPFEGAQQSAANTCLVEILDDPQLVQQTAAKRSKTLKDTQALLLRIVKFALNEAGEFVKSDLTIPPTVRAVERTLLRKYLKPRGYWDDDRTDAHNRGELSRDLKALAARNIIGLTSEYVWLTGKE